LPVKDNHQDAAKRATLPLAPTDFGTQYNSDMAIRLVSRYLDIDVYNRYPDVIKIRY